VVVIGVLLPIIVVIGVMLLPIVVVHGSCCDSLAAPEHGSRDPMAGSRSRVDQHVALGGDEGRNHHPRHDHPEG
jgi:hypothetical protein